MYYERLTKQYSISKTIRNELIPIGKTLDNIRHNNIIESDELRKKHYKRVKEIMDDYHEKIINDALSHIKLVRLDDAANIYLDGIKDASSVDSFVKLQGELRTEISKKLQSHKDFKSVGKKEILNLLPIMTDNPEDLEAIKGFNNFYTYFVGYNKVRENLYSDEEKASTVAYRMINENLPRFLDNIRIKERIKDFGIEVEGLSEEEFDTIFMVDTFNRVLTQDGINNYNEAVGKTNFAVNLYNQQHAKEGGFKKLPMMKELYKQILSDRKESFIDEFLSDEELIDNLDSFCAEIKDLIKSDDMVRFFDALYDSSGENVFVKNDTAKTMLSNIVYDSWSRIDELIFEEYDSHFHDKKKDERYYEKREKELKKNKSYSLAYLSNLSPDEINIIDKYINRIKEDIDDVIKAAKEFEDMVLEKHDRTRKLQKNTKAVESIKVFLDSIKELERDIKLINGSGLESEKNLVVYGEQDNVLTEIKRVDALYNMTRNYLTKKPFSTEKIKINFNRPTLLDGWDRNKEEANLGLLFVKAGCYYLGIMNPDYNKAFRNIPEAKTENTFKKINYKLLPGPNKMLPKVFFADSNADLFAPSEELLKKYKKGTHKKGEDFSLEDCHNLIDYFKESINKHEDWSKFGFNFSDTTSYKDMSDFYREVEKQGYKITYTDVDADYINKLVDDGQLYLFQIYNKDFSKYSKGNYNLHTLYLTMLFDDRNLKNVVYKLNGEAEVFYRPASIKADERVIHEANKEIKNSNPNRAKSKPVSVFNYDIIKDKRYTEDKFMIHIPITLNFGVAGNNKINDSVNNALREEGDVRVIGIDRGERNLLYLVVVDSKGNILEQRSLNSIINSVNGEYDIETDYHKLLDDKESDRERSRQNWNTIENIKDLKAGYLSQVVHVITSWIIKYNAIVCLEDLNFGFKRGRQKFEKQVYQKFEKMLIDKLNYLVTDKSRDQVNPEKIGGALNALQLTSGFESFKKLGKQTGVIFYVPAYLTSKIDPTTGFANLFYNKYTNMEKAKEFIRRFDAIRYNSDDNLFEFDFDYKSFTDRATGPKHKWTVCSYGKRIVKYRNPDKNNMFDDKEVDITEEIKNLLEQNGIAYKTGNDLMMEMLEISDAKFFASFIRLFNLILQMRNSTGDGMHDYIISPVKNDKGRFYNSEDEKLSLPKDADANGAFNIARKGLWVLEQIKQSADGTKINLAMTNEQWLEYAQTHTV